MTTIRTYTNQLFYLSRPEPDLVCLQDIAAGLRAYRWSAQSPQLFTIAQHSLLVERLLEMEGEPPSVCLAGLMHDAHEAYIADVTTPAKETMRNGSTAASDFDRLESKVQDAVGVAFGISDEEFRAVKHADTGAMLIERSVLWGGSREGLDYHVSALLDTKHPDYWMNRFLYRHAFLSRQIKEASCG